MPRILGLLTVLALALGAGCDKPAGIVEDSAAAAASVNARALPVIWAELLAQRDRIQAAVAKGTDMWHPECEQVSTAAVAMDTLAVELGQRVEIVPSLAARRRGIHEVIGYMQVTGSSLRENAVEGVVGELPGLMIGLDAILQALEKRFTRDEIGSDSVVTRPGFNPIQSPPPPSPI